MSSDVCKYTDRGENKNSHISHNALSRLDISQPMNDNYQVQTNPTTHSRPFDLPISERPNCQSDIYCSRDDCYYNHPNGKFNDASVNNSNKPPISATKQPNQTSPDVMNIEVIHCKFGRNCQKLHCYLKHPAGRDIDRNPAMLKELKRSAQLEEELIEKICQLLVKAQEEAGEQQQKDNTDDDDESNEPDEEQFVDIDSLQNNSFEQFKLQKKQFQTAIDHLIKKFDPIIQLDRGNKNNLLQLQRIDQQLQREFKRWQSRLPIYARRRDIIEKLRQNQVLILKADTGSGKSTQVVQYLCDEYLADSKRIISTQPRKLAARSLAARVAEEYGCQVGEEVGFQVGGSRSVTSQKTKIKFVTDTLFLYEYQLDPMLRKYSIVIVDEAHERKIDTDIVFGVMKQCLRKRNDLQLVIMSATLDMDLLHTYFAREFQCSTLEVSGRTYPIEDIYLVDDVENYVEASVAKAIEIHQSNEIGDILVFLTGQDEIDLALAELNQRLENDSTYIGLPLHGKLSEEENSRIFEKMSNKRKIIFSTNVAETSVTIDGIKHVIDSGMVKEKMWDEKRKMQVLKIGEITKSSVKQRRGRAGRTSSGKCYHLYTVETYEAMDTCSRAEILCTQPTLAILKLKHLNIDDIESFDWLEPPSDSSLCEAYQTLIWLNAIDSRGKLTSLGRDMARLDMDPKLTAMIRKAEELNCVSYALILAGMLTVSQNIWWTNKDSKSKDMATQTRAKLSHESGDHITLINIYLKWSRLFTGYKSRKQQYEWCKNNSINGKSLQMAHDFIREKARQLSYQINITGKDDVFNQDLVNRILRCALAGYFLNLAVSNGPFRAGYQVISAFSSAGGESITARIFRTSTLCFNDQMPKYVVYNELLNVNGMNYITILSSINLDWLKSVSQQWFTTIDGENLHTISYETHTIKNIGPTLLRAVAGKRHCHLNRFEELTHAIIDVDYKQASLTLWARQINLEQTKNLIEQMIEKERQKLLTEAEEIHIIGRTRILMGSGAVSQMILVEDEFIRIIMNKFPGTITEERIQKICEPFGKIRNIDFIRQTEQGSCVAVTYSTIEEARSAVTGLNGHIEHGREITVSSSCLQTDATTDRQICRLKAIWYLTASSGNGKIIFSDEKNALDAFQFFKRSNYHCNYERLTDIPTLKVIYYLAENNGKAFVNFGTSLQAQSAVIRMSNAPAITLARAGFTSTKSVIYQGIPNEFDEIDVRNHFRHCPGVGNVQVLRGRRGQRFQRPPTAEDDIRSIFKSYPSFQPNTITFHENIVNGKLEAYVEFLDINDLKLAIENLDGRTNLLGFGKVRLSERIRKKRKDEENKKKENEYIIRFQRLNVSYDRYDLIKILQDNQLYDHVKSVIVFRQKSDDKRSLDIWSDISNVQMDEDFGLSRLRSMLGDAQHAFHSIPDCQISSSLHNGTVIASVVFKDPTDMITAIQMFDNKYIELSHRLSRLRLIPSISHEIFINAALTQAIPKKIEHAIERIQGRFKRVYIKSIASKKSEGAATMKIFLDSDDIQQITMAKIEFDNLMKGLEYQFENDAEKTRILFDHDGFIALQRIEKETSTYIWRNVLNSFVRIYGNDQDSIHAWRRIDAYIRNTLKDQKQTITLDIPHGLVRQVLKMSATYHETVGKQYNVDISTVVARRQIQITGRGDDLVKCEQAIRKGWSTMSVEKQTSITTTVECPICYNPANYSLQACGHVYCLDCLRQELSTKFDTTLSNETLKVKCMMPQCDLPLLLRDIKTIIHPKNVSKLARASLRAYLKTDEDIVRCIGIDCNQVYRKSKHLQSYFCDGCLKMYCTKCEAEYHIGLTCDAYQTLLRWKVEEGPTMHNIGNLDLKPCPSCKQVIDRYDGCNAVTCKCGIHFCWLCLKTDPIDIHSHYNDRTSDCFDKMFYKKRRAVLDAEEVNNDDS